MRTAATDLAPAPGGRLPDRPLFAIGDIHGHSDALAAILGRLRDVIETEFAGREVDVVYLGDYVDRGPDPRGVLELARDGLGLPQARETALMGNHDRFLIDAAGLRGAGYGLSDWAMWMANGGRETLKGFGFSAFSMPDPAALQGAIGHFSLSFLENLELSFRSGEVFCAHAGVDPAKPLDAQEEQDLLWIRGPFLLPAERPGEWPPGVTVVHGHTPNAFGMFAHRVGVDSGGYATRVFTALELSERGARFHHVDIE